MKFSEDAKCEHCGAKRNKGALRIDITGLGMGGQLPTYPISIPTHYVICKNPDCMAEDLNKMRDDLLSKFPKKKTSVISSPPANPNGC